MQKRINLFLVFLVLCGGVLSYAELSGSYLVPLDHEAIQYAKQPVNDPIAHLAQKVARGDVKLEFEDNGFGYLRSMLKALDLPIESQVLVFSKTSFQAPRIGARTPRALYFNDTMSLGFVRSGDVLELAAVDPRQGVIFYSLDQEKVDRPRFERRDTCLQCHQSGGTLGIPGIVVRSVFPEPSGMPIFNAGTFVSDHRSPIKERWGGWYVTGTHGDTRHMGNAVVRDREHPDQLEAEGTQNLTGLSRKFDTGAYLAPTSDIVALLTLEHQTHMTNLITRVNYETRMALHYQAGINKTLQQPDTTMSESTNRRINSAVEELVAYLLFVDETPLQSPVKGTSGFAQTFAKRGPRDHKGRSLRDFNLQTRIFKYPLSYMIYAPNFDGMDPVAKERIYQKLYDVLTGKDTNKKFARLTPAERQAIREILVDTKPGLPAYWKTTAASSTGD